MNQEPDYPSRSLALLYSVAVCDRADGAASVLADPIMQFEGDAQANAAARHANSNTARAPTVEKTASRRGGCGCN